MLLSQFRGLFFLPHPKQIAILCFSVCGLFSIASAQNPVIVSKMESSVRFDGMPDEEAWNKIIPLPVTTLQPVSGKEPTEKTEILLGYTDEYFWIGGKFYDSDPSQIQLNTKKRDDYGDDNDFFGIMIDCLNDNENGFIFHTTPAGNRLDMAISNDARIDSHNTMPFNVSWNTFWDVKTTLTEKGWFIELRIPFSSLRFKVINDKISMGFTAFRWIPRKNEMIVFPALDPKYGKWVRYQPSMGHDIILQGIKATNPVYITPYILGGESISHDLDVTGTSYKKSVEPTLEAGLDLKYGINSNLTLDLTINTDFAQVEDDDQKVNITRYSLFYPERRLFFQERSDIFNFNLGRDANLFYSRRIGLINDTVPVRILGGARLTGKIGKFDIGFIDMQTAKYSAEQPSENFSALRFKHNILNPYSYAGGILTSKIGTDGSYNLTYGLDSYIKVFGDDYIDIKFSQSYGSGKEYKRVADNTFLRLFLERRNNEGWGYRISGNWSGEEFKPAMGFLMRENNYSMGGRLRYGWIPGEKSFLYTHQIFLKYISYYSTKGFLETLYAGPGWTFETKNKFSAELEPEFRKEVLTDTFFLDNKTFVVKGDYSFYSFRGRLVTPGSLRFNVESEYELGQYYDGSILSVRLKPQWALSRSVKIEGQYQYNNVQIPKRDQNYMSHILGLKILYMFSTKLTASAFVQYNSLEDIYLTNLRIRFNPKEGNDFYLVFNEGRNTDIMRQSPNLPRIEDQTLQVKYSHTFRL